MNKWVFLIIFIITAISLSVVSISIAYAGMGHVVPEVNRSVYLWANGLSIFFLALIICELIEIITRHNHLVGIREE